MWDFDCSDVEAALWQIWDEFRKEGISDDLKIIEGLAVLLLGEKADIWKNVRRDENPANITGYANYEFVDAFPNTSIDGFLDITEYGLGNEYRRQKVLGTLQNLPLTVRANLGRLFDQCMIPRMKATGRGGRYPTPRHIAAAMFGLADVSDGDHLADLACGTGGLLAASATYETRITGVEISPNLARIAQANMALNDLTATIRVGNAFEVYSHHKRESMDPEFDRVVINPPFGESVDKALTEAFAGGRSETLFVDLALQKLKPSGRLVTLLPRSTFFARGREYKLRQELVDLHRLRAVISLPPDAFQPYNSVPTHILIVDKAAPGTMATNYVWFFDVRHDGFSSGRNRKPEPEKDELPRVSRAFQIGTSFADFFNPEPEFIAPLLGFQRSVSDREQLAPSQKAFYCFISSMEEPFVVQQVSAGEEGGLIGKFEKAGAPQYCLVWDDQYYLKLPDTSPLDLEKQIRPQQKQPVFYEVIDEKGENTRIRLTKKQPKQTEPSTTVPAPCMLWVDLKGSPISLLLSEPRVSGVLQSEPLRALGLENEQGDQIGWAVVFARPQVPAYPMQGRSENPRTGYLIPHKEGYLVAWAGEANTLPQWQVLSSTTAFTGQPYHRAVATDPQGQWFGVMVPASEIRKRDYDLQPETYFPSRAVAQDFISPAALAASIKTRQSELNRRIDALLDLTAGRAVTAQPIPPPLAEAPRPLGALSATQSRVWQAIQAQVETVGSGKKAYLVPRPFQAEDLLEALPELSESDVEKTLELLLCMGEVVAITLDDAPYYRLLTASDLVGAP